MADRCREIAAQFGSAHVGMNSNYFASNSKSIDFVTVFGIAALVLAGGYVVIQSIFRISVNDKIQSYGQLRTIGATPRQIRRSVGLTGKQLCRMSITEGMCHALFAALTVLILGLPISMAVCAEVSKKSFAGAVVPYQFPFLQMGLFLLVLFGMEVVLSVWMVRRQKKQSLVEQIRAQS